MFYYGIGGKKKHLPKQRSEFKSYSLIENYQAIFDIVHVSINYLVMQSVWGGCPTFFSFLFYQTFTDSPSLCPNRRRKSLCSCQLESFDLLSYFSVSLGNIFNDNSLFSITQACAHSHRMKSFPKHLFPERTFYSKLGYLPAFQKVICCTV